MADFEEAYNYVMGIEKGTANHLADHGGLTVDGIASKYHPEVDVTKLTSEQKKEIYRKEYWGNYGKIRDGFGYQGVANKMLDIAVNCGRQTANRILQATIAKHFSHDERFPVDGIFGEKTIMAVNQWGDKFGFETALTLELVRYYTAIVNRNQSQMVFYRGWINRALRPANI